MNEKQPSTDSQEAIESTNAKRLKTADRIGKRVIRQTKKGKLSTIVKGGPLGLRATTHPPEVYPHVAEKVAPEGIDIAVHRAEGWVGVLGDPYGPPPTDIITTKAIHGRPTDAPLHGVTRAEDVKRVTQLYPPTEESVRETQPLEETS